jgi:predicted DNA-binding transcriptional regulator YafY
MTPDTHTLEAAVRAEQPLWLTYPDAVTGPVLRTVSPYEVRLNANGGRTLLSWDHDQEGIRTFRLDRIHGVEAAPPGISFVPPEDDR